MTDDVPYKALKPLVTDKFIDKRQKKENTKRYVPYSFTQGLRKAMAHLNADNIQQLDANRSFNTERESIDSILSSDVSDIMEGDVVKRKQFELEFDRAEDGDFPWLDIQSVLGQSSTVYDLPVRRLVVRFEDDEFENEWRDAIREALDMNNPPLSWIESPFYAVLESSDPGEGDARDRVREVHEDFYFKPMFEAEADYEGMDWPIRTLDLQSVWSYQAFINRAQAIHTVRKDDRQYDWTPRKLEKYIMNYFQPSEDYTGVIRSSDFAGLWRRVYSRDITSTKVFEWEEDEEWVQTEA
ncbi:hypothetical protein [Halapricum desulfuricans]|uniref:hypothetical protein n=1 Tax=Halapricum desulfuricans TaxID=2841257 RepID=UPI001E352018|nr:hypothetical protein [Halapricum desulfuricans]